MMAESETLLFTKEGPVAHISLNRPQVLNAYNVQMRDEFSEFLSAVHDDAEVRSLLITGQGRAFCAGADLTEFGSAPSLAVARKVRWERDVWGQLLSLPKPVVAALQGYCIGSGLEIALLCDLRIAATDTIFGMPELLLGMIPAAGGTQTLARSAGTSAALDLLLTGRRFGAEEALRLKLITRAVPPDQLPTVAWEMVRQMATVEVSAMAAVKTALREGPGLPLAQALQLESRLAALL